MRWWSALFFVLLGLPAVAHAECPDHRVLTFEGECCWLGQTWDGARCVGPPECPAPLIAHGDTCVARMRPPPLPAVEAAIALRAPEEPRTEQVASPRHTLVGIGATHLAFGWTGAAVVSGFLAGFGGGFGPSCRVSHAPWGFVPLLGSAVVPIAVDLCESVDPVPEMWLIFGAATAFQAAGLVMILVGWIDRVPVWRSIEATARGLTIRF